jgi:DNA-binding transcriptional ArsR family regulator
MKDDQKNPFDIFQAKNDGELSANLSERKHEGFRKLVIGVFRAFKCLGFPGAKELQRMQSLDRCNGVIKAMAADLGEEQSNISHWLLTLEKTYLRNKRRLEGRKKPKKK